MMRKVNFAATVKEKTPYANAAIWLLRANYSNIDGLCMLRICWTGIQVCDIIICTHYGDSMPVRSRSKPPKLEALREEGTLNPTPDEVHDPKFQENEFFDPHDIVQVKYEMLRRVSVENASVSAATEEYGVSRPTYYQTKATFDKGGVAGLVPQKRGPRGPHKLRGQALAFVQQQLVAGEPVRARELAKLVRQKFDLNIHPRTIERAVAGKKTPR
jgi:transposase